MWPKIRNGIMEIVYFIVWPKIRNLIMEIVYFIVNNLFLEFDVYRECQVV